MALVSLSSNRFEPCLRALKLLSNGQRPDEELTLAYRGGMPGPSNPLRPPPLAPFPIHFAEHQAACHRELYQDVWIRVIEARASYNATARFTTWPIPSRTAARREAGEPPERWLERIA